MFILLIPTLAQTAVHVLTLALTELSNQRKQSNIDIIKDSRPEPKLAVGFFIYQLTTTRPTILFFFSFFFILLYSSLFFFILLSSFFLSPTFFFLLLSSYFLILSSFHIIQPSSEAPLYKPHHKQHFHLNKNRHPQ